MTRECIEITDLGENRIAVKVGTQAEVVAFHSQVDHERLEDLRWYVEEFYDTPFGGARERARSAKNAMQTIGVDLFKSVISPPHAQAALTRVRASQGTLELVLRSTHDQFLALPWELIKADGTEVFLAEQGLAVVREYLGATTTNLRAREPGPVRLLLIIARPQQFSVPSIATIAESLLNIAGQVDSQLEVDVLRPPTVAQLRQQLAQRDYDIVHFDGHGVFPSIADLRGAESAQGHLVFESNDEYPDIVSAASLVAMLPPHPPIFILNACESGRAGLEQPMSSVAAQLLQAGSSAVLAMSHVVRAETIHLFMQPFYEALVGDADLAQAVAQARKMLLQTLRRDDQRQDWFIPVLFQHGHSHFFERSSFAKTSRNTEIQTSALARLLGRSDEVLATERALRHSSCVLLTGAIGTGKSEFSRSFAAWYEQTGAVGKSIFINVADIENVAGAVNITLGAKVDESEEIRLYQLKQLAQRGLMLVWDHAEKLLAGADAGAALQNISEVLRAHGGSLLLTTSATIPSNTQWPCVFLSDLPNKEAGERIACGLSHVLQAEPAQSRGLILRAISACEFHARAIDLFVAATSTSTVESLVNDLKWGCAAGGPFVDRHIDAMYSLLSDKARRILPLLGLFGRHIQPGTLIIFTNGGLKDDVYGRIYGAHVDEKEWHQCLMEAYALGLVERLLDGFVFSLSVLLRRRLRQALVELHSDCPEIMEELADGFIIWGAGLLAVWSKNEIHANSVAVAETSFIRALEASIVRKRFSQAATILGCLSQAWVTLDSSSVHWLVEESLEHLFPTDFPANDNELVFWAQLRSVRATAAAERGDIGLLAELDQEIIARLEGMQEPALLRHIATSLQRLVRMCLRSGSRELVRSYLDRLEPLAMQLGDDQIKSECVSTRLLLTHGAATDALQNDIAAPCEDHTPQAALTLERAGNAARSRGDYATAHAKFVAAWRCWTLLGRIDAAMNTRGLVADALVGMGQIREALPIYMQQVRHLENTGKWGRAANCALMIAQTYEQLGDLGSARRWCDSAAPVLQQLGMEMELAHLKHELGIIELRSPEPNYSQATAFFHAAIDVYAKLGSAYHQASSLMILAQIQQNLGDNVNALATLRRSIQVCPHLRNDTIDAQRQQLLLDFEASGVRTE